MKLYQRPLKVLYIVENRTVGSLPSSYTFLAAYCATELISFHSGTMFASSTNEVTAVGEIDLPQLCEHKLRAANFAALRRPITRNLAHENASPQDLQFHDIQALQCSSLLGV